MRGDDIGYAGEGPAVDPEYLRRAAQEAQKQAYYETQAVEQPSFLNEVRRRRDTLVRRRETLNNQIDILTQFMRVFED